MLLIVVGWLYVALMMAVAEAHHPNGSLLGAVLTFVLYGVGPVALVVYLMRWPTRRAARAEREAQEAAEAAAARAAAENASKGSGQPGGGGEPPTDPVPPVRKEP